jgi:class 3 adenylate cyclase/GAF domain-containing protein
VVFPTDWIKRASNDLRRVGESLLPISRQLHEYARKLGNLVEGEYASEADDPRVRLLSEALHISSEADKRLSWANQELYRITQGWPNQSSHPLTSRPNGNKELAISLSSLQQERNELETLSQIARELNSTLEFNSVLERVMDRVIRFVNAERGFLMLINPTTQEPEFTIARDERSQPIDESQFATISRDTVRRVIHDRKPMFINDAQADPTKSMLMHSISSIMCAPLIVRGDCIGAVYVDRRLSRSAFESLHRELLLAREGKPPQLQETTAFEPRHHELLLAFCDQAAIAIQNARLFEQIRKDKQYMDNIFGSIANGVVTTDSAGKITAFNAAASFILALSPDQAIHRHYMEVFKLLPEGVGLIPLLNKAHTEHEHGTVVNEPIECTIPGRSGTISLNCYVSSLRDTQGEHIGMALVIDDQTAIKEARAKVERIRTMFERYVHPHVVQELMKNPRALNLGGETKEISVVFADIRGYTLLSESMQPYEVMHMINGYLEKMCDAIWEEKGTLTAFLGDALMAIFNAPLHQDDHALRAVRAAWYMREAVRNYQRELPEELRVSFGFGVNTGPATVGNVGAPGRLQNYTAIGDTINVASRLQNRATDNDIYVNNSTYWQVYSHALFDQPLSLTVKNKTARLTVHRLLRLL